jgi:hypothetical protein
VEPVTGDLGGRCYMVRSDEKLELGATAVNYELGALVDCYRRLLRAEGDFDAIGKNAYLEAMLVHARCLIEFIAKPRNKDHIHRHDYIDDWDVNDTAASDRARKLFSEISKHLSHLSWRRARTGQPEARWPYELPNLVMKLFTEFAVEVRRVDGEKPWAALFESGVQYGEMQLRRAPRRTGDGATTSDAHMVVSSSAFGARPVRPEPED